MRICVFGAGAVGSVVAANMHRVGLDVTLIARGPTLAAIRDKGLVVRRGDEEIIAQLKVTDDVVKAGPQDLVITTLKVPAVRNALAAIKPLIGPETVVVPAHNGIPWWYFYALPGDWPKQHLDSVDPGGSVWQGLGPERTLGTIVGMGTAVVEPGVVLQVGPSGDTHGRFPIGEPDGSESDRARCVSEVFQAAGFASEVSTEIRTEVWLKILTNIGANPISLLTLGTMADMLGDDSIVDLKLEMLRECYALSKRLGITLPGTPEERIELFKSRSGPFKPSTLQDLENGKPVEVDAIVGAVSEIGRMVDVDTPLIDAVYALSRLRAITAGCYVEP